MTVGDLIDAGFIGSIRMIPLEFFCVIGFIISPVWFFLFMATAVRAVNWLHGRVFKTTLFEWMS